MTLTRRWATAFCTFIMAGTLHAQQQTPGIPIALTTGDQLRVTVWRRPEFSGEFTVAADGTLLHPLYKEVSVRGVSMSVVEERLRAFLTRYETNPQFVVQPLVRVVVGGEVRSPNLLSIPPETSIAQAIALAGGPTDRGRLSRVRVLRDGQEIRIDVSRPESDAATMQVRSGDQILVGRQGVLIRDYIAPISSSVAAIVTIVSLITR